MDSVSSKKKKRSDGEVEPIISPSLKRSLKGKKRRKHDKSHMSKPSEAESVASEDGETVEECRSSDLEGEVQASCPYPDSTLRIAKGTIFDEEGIEDERLYMEAHTIVYKYDSALPSKIIDSMISIIVSLYSKGGRNGVGRGDWCQ